MVTRIVLCPDCQSQNVIRFGKTTGGHARFRCKDCRVTFSDAPERGHSEVFKAQVLAAYQERASMRGIARAFGIGRTTLVRWLKEKGGNCPT